MTAKKINQLVPAFHYGDAIGDEILSINSYAESAGYDSNIFCIDPDPEVSRYAQSHRRFRDWDAPDAVNILHFALPSPLTDIFQNSKGKKILIYHNITPAEWFLDHDKELCRIAVAGRCQLARLAGCCDLALGDSEYNRQELETLGFNTTGVLPIAVDFSRYDLPDRPVIKEMFRDDFTNFIFVGRVSPNKCHEDILKIYAFYKKFVRERCRLFIVGRFSGFFKYYVQLHKLMEKLKLGDVYFTNHVETDELATYYRMAHIFLGMSEHEGFCVPLLEAMHFQVPIIAYNASAVPDTLKGAGVLINSKHDPFAAAELAHIICEDAILKMKLLKKQNEILNNYSIKNFYKKIEIYLSALGQ